MTDMETKDQEQEETLQTQGPAEGPQEPQEGSPSPPAPAAGDKPETPPAEPQEAAPIEEAAPIPETPPAPEEAPGQIPPWQDIHSHAPAPEPVWTVPPQGGWAEGAAPAPSPWQGQQTGEIPLHAPAPPAWPGQPGAMPPAGQVPPPYGQAYYGGYAPYYPGCPPQPNMQQGPQPDTPPAPQYPGYYPGYPGYAPPYAGYPQPAAQPAPPPKKKKPLGLKILLWLVSILAAGSLIGFGVYAAVMLNDSGPHYPDLPDITETKPAPSLPDGSPEESMPQEEQPEDLPNVDVTPNTDGIQLQPKPQGEPLEPEELYNQVVKSTVGITATLTREGQTAQSRGSGIIATSDGYIITNAHVVLNSKSARVKVSVYDGQEYDAVVVGVDRTTDLAVIKTNDHNFTPAAFGDADDLSMGEWVMALGNPGGSKYANSLTRGIVSGLNREAGQYSVGGMTYIQTDAAINPGNSGGPLVNMYGQVVGINSSKIITENYEGMGFAIPVTQARPIINELLSGGYIKGRTRLGIMIQEVDAGTSMMAQVPMGLRITQINDDSAFLGTDAQEGDIITALDGEAVTTLRDVSDLLTGYAPGDQVEVTLYRPASNAGGEGHQLTVTITLLEDKGETQE